MLFHIKIAKRLCVLKDKKGFTLLEAMMGIFIMSVIALLILQVILVVSKNDLSGRNIRQLNLFTMQIQADFLSSYDVEVENEKLNFDQPDNIVTYKMKNNKLLRQVNSKGSETALMNISKIKFEKNKDIVKMEVRFSNDKTEYHQVLGEIKFK